MVSLWFLPQEWHSGTVPSKDGHTHYTAQFKASTPWGQTSKSHDSKGYFSILLTHQSLFRSHPCFKAFGPCVQGKDLFEDGYSDVGPSLGGPVLFVFGSIVQFADRDLTRSQSAPSHQSCSRRIAPVRLFTAILYPTRRFCLVFGKPMKFQIWIAGNILMWFQERGTTWFFAW